MHESVDDDFRMYTSINYSYMPKSLKRTKTGKRLIKQRASLSVDARHMAFLASIYGRS